MAEKYKPGTFIKVKCDSCKKKFQFRLPLRLEKDEVIEIPCPLCGESVDIKIPQVD